MNVKQSSLNYEGIFLDHQSVCNYGSIFWDYYELAACAELNNEQAERLDAILAQAEEDEWLNFLLNEADYIVGMRLGYLSDTQMKKFKDQMAWLREYVEQMPDGIEYHRGLQRLLQGSGFYKGPVDGVFGNDTQLAVKQFQEKKKLKVDGIPGFSTFFLLAHENLQLSERSHEQTTEQNAKSK